MTRARRLSHLLSQPVVPSHVCLEASHALDALERRNAELEAQVSALTDFSNTVVRLHGEASIKGARQ
ncbi:hypothetical protein [Tropicimonas sp. IMCC34011]|uniref:hypothetical protein n=1 Tax=Tropicimonas sp. IMCC34011 TaxID=2248759 RepID=UPI000E2371AE|nr:hypothetical protein [Tropicimonas sp. IMCC34011]